MKRNSSQLPRQLSSNMALNPIAPNVGDEYYVNGIFHFNTSGLRNEIESNISEFLCVRTKVSLWWEERTIDLDADCVDSADLDSPLIIAEIAPDRYGYYPNIDPDNWPQRGYNLINGYHCVEKAHRLGVSHLPAYIVPMEKHIYFMFKGFDSYVDYWNGKLADYMSDQKRRER